jgi:hypothetical protein
MRSGVWRWLFAGMLGACEGNQRPPTASGPPSIPPPVHPGPPPWSCVFRSSPADAADRQRGVDAIEAWLARGVGVDIAVSPPLVFTANPAEAAAIDVIRVEAVGADCPESSHLAVRFDAAALWSEFAHPEHRIRGVLKLSGGPSDRLVATIELAAAGNLQDWAQFFASIQDLMYAGPLPPGSGWSSGAELADVATWPVWVWLEGTVDGGEAEMVLSTADGLLPGAPVGEWRVGPE